MNTNTTTIDIGKLLESQKKFFDRGQTKEIAFLTVSHIIKAS
jgi:hypothetical protein